MVGAETGVALPAAAGASARVPILNKVVVVSALGYFVDIYDLLLFSIVRVQSLADLGVPRDSMLDTGVLLLNAQMAGLLVGGFLFGILGDKRGRLSVLFGSIALYSVANLANAFVTDVTQYAILRFVAGVGLAGELGAAITLVNETMPPETRGWGAAIVAGIGILGAVFAGLVGAVLPWREAFLLGGLLGLGLLVLRVRMVDSGMYKGLDRHVVRMGDLRLLVGHGARFRTYAYSTLIGLPIWFMIGVILTFSPEIAATLGASGPVTAGFAVMSGYAGASLGALLSGFASQVWRSRRWAVLAFLALGSLCTVLLPFLQGISPAGFYALCFVLGIGFGYWAIFVTMASEQFGTNLRSTVTTTVPNLIRGSVLPITLAFQALRPSVGLINAALAVGVVTILIALWALRSVDETFGKDLDYVDS